MNRASMNNISILMSCVNNVCAWLPASNCSYGQPVMNQWVGPRAYKAQGEH